MPIKQKLHPRNKHNRNYDFQRLCSNSPSLSQHIIANKLGQRSINFADALAVRALNGAILKADYDIENWKIPTGFLCPPIPGRADYIHYIADLLSATNNQLKSQKRPVTGLDIGTGASCIYPLLGQREYLWNFVASDIDPVSIRSSQRIVDSNQGLGVAIKLKLQPDSQKLFRNIIGPKDVFDFTMCNPPFHKSLAQANQSSTRKRRNLGTNRKGDSALNFGGQNAELWCEGGERKFIKMMISESAEFSHQVLWFTCLVSSRDNVQPLKRTLGKVGASEIQTVSMAQGQKVSRFLAWTFLKPEQRAAWHRQP